MFLSAAPERGVGEGTLPGTVRSLPAVPENRKKVVVPAQVQHEYDEEVWPFSANNWKHEFCKEFIKIAIIGGDCTELDAAQLRRCWKTCREGAHAHGSHARDKRRAQLRRSDY